MKKTTTPVLKQPSKQSTGSYNKEAMDFAITALAKGDQRFMDVLVTGYFFYRWKYKEEGRAMKPSFIGDETWYNACFDLTEDEQLFFDLCSSTRVVLSVESVTERVRIQPA